MEQFLDYIERYKFAILGTILFHVLFFLCSNFVTIERPYKIVPEVTEIEIDATEIEISPEMMELMKQQNPEESQDIRNMAADENDTRERSYENFSSQSVDQQVEEEARALEQQYFEEWAKTHEGDGPSNSSSERDDRENRNDRNPQNQNPNRTIDSEGDNAYAGVTLVSYNLKDRKAHALEVPSYKCNGSGTVVIDIKVDKSGTVRDATYNSSLSRGATECMIENAKSYAKRSRFNYGGSGGTANGTITYKFQGQ